jgi:transcriptional regulator
MHKTHKTQPNLSESEKAKLKSENSSNQTNKELTTNLLQPTVLDVEKENRLAKIILLCSKGLPQSEIAKKLGVDQSIVSRDLQFIKQQAKREMEKYLNDGILFEYLRYIAVSDEVSAKLWEIIESQDITTKDRKNALSLLMQANNKRLEILTSGAEAYMNAKKSMSEAKFQDRVDRDPLLSMLNDKGSQYHHFQID